LSMGETGKVGPKGTGGKKRMVLDGHTIKRGGWDTAPTFPSGAASERGHRNGNQTKEEVKKTSIKKKNH